MFVVLKIYEVTNIDGFMLLRFAVRCYAEKYNLHNNIRNNFFCTNEI